MCIYKSCVIRLIALVKGKPPPPPLNVGKRVHTASVHSYNAYEAWR